MPADTTQGAGALTATTGSAGSEVRLVDQSWADCDLRSSGRNELFVDRSWWSVLSDSYGLDVCVRQAVDGAGRSLGAVPWVEIDDLAGPRIVSLPFCDFVDAPMTPAGWSVLGPSFLDQNLSLSFSTPADHELSSDERFLTDVDGVHHEISVGDPDTMVGGFAELTRRMIRKAEKSGMRYRLLTDAHALEQYYWLHVGVRKYRHGLLAQSPDFFRAVSENFFAAGNGGVLLADVDGQLAGGCVLLVTPSAVHYKFAAANPDFYRHGVSHGLVLAALRVTVELGIETFDFGRSDLVHDGLIDFKRRFRPAERKLARHRVVVGATSEQARAKSAAFDSHLRELTELYTESVIPDHLSAAAGAHLYRYFA